jgi:malonate-semialdehyde dehydrogenase (acetylating)/methylmalonate-semialdehyde dehydrogenase
MTPHIISNYINGEWHAPATAEYYEVINPATGEILARTPLSRKDEVGLAALSATAALPGWRRTPAQERVQYLFKLKFLLEEHLDEISRTITNECGKTYEEAKAEMRRAIENVEIAAGIPMMAKGEISEDIAPGIDEIMLRQPVGVCATICPFNFPGMIPFWYLPYALACGNTYLVKPSEKVPMTMQLIFQLIDQIALPKGVINLVNGAKEAVDGILDHPAIRAITFVGATATARYIYRRAAENGKRVQAQGGAKNPVIVLPDADMEMATKIIADSAFGCAGQRCLAVSLAVTVGEARNSFVELICDAAASRKVGYGLDSGVQMGPVINQGARSQHPCRWSQPHHSRISKRSVRTANDLAGYASGGRNPPDRNLWSSTQPDPREYDGRGYCYGQPRHLRQPGQPVHIIRVSGAQVPLRSGCGKYWHQHRCGRADGILSVQWLEGKLLWRPARPGY